ncbi:UDP-diphosphatase [Candidatus Micrarchaeota archaeon]|nr:MAG: UDP-diphosphatase [Candidatus Micrarchaeota archaeon]
MNPIEAIILGIIQGISEWLPISSEAMVALAGRFLFNLEYSKSLSTAIWLHSGTLLAAVIYFRKDLVDLIKGNQKQLLLFLAAATLATAVLAFPLLLLAFTLKIPDSIFTMFIGLFLVFVAFAQKNRKKGLQEEPELKKGALAGLIQGLAVLPGISRSGITIATLLGENYTLKQAFRLSFLMSIPVAFGVQLALPLVKGGFQPTAPLLAGGLAAALVGLLTIGALMKFAERVNFFKATLFLGLLVLLLGASLLL